MEDYRTLLKEHQVLQVTPVLSGKGYPSLLCKSIKHMMKMDPIQTKCGRPCGKTEQMEGTHITLL